MFYRVMVDVRTETAANAIAAAMDIAQADLLSGLDAQENAAMAADGIRELTPILIVPCEGEVE